MTATIRTNHHPRSIKYRDEVPDRILASEFDWLDDDEYDGFIHYRNQWFHLSQFMRVDPDGSLALLGWDGYHGDSFFSATLIRLIDDETVLMASYYC